MQSQVSLIVSLIVSSACESKKISDDHVLGILCAQSGRSINDWLDYDWVGAPWSKDARYGGNGGLSLRKVSSIITVLKNQVRINNSDPEDVWLSERLAHLTGANIANGTMANQFSVENTNVERPMGYHIGTSGRVLPTAYLGSIEKRKKVWDYCPELKMVLEMDAPAYMTGHCNENWGRDNNEFENNESTEEFIPW